MSAGAQGLEVTKSSDFEIAGRLPAAEVELSVFQGLPDQMVVEIKLRDEKVLRAEIDYLTRQVRVRSLSQITGKPVALEAVDLAALRSLGEASKSVSHGRAGEALTRTLLFLSVYPSGETIDYSSPSQEGKAKDNGQDKAISSLCGVTGKSATGKYTVKKDSFQKTVQVGPCYNQSNECMGRCGPGCNAPPISTVQIFTQHCLDHDLCTRATGTILGECKDEWAAAGDDFFFGRDCGDLDGKWTDNFGFTWTLNESTLVLGKVASPRCSQSSVVGSHDGAKINLRATISKPKEGCCKSFTYKGEAKSCNTASGTWQNVCGFNGTWSMKRNNGKVSFLMTEEEGQAPDSQP